MNFKQWLINEELVKYRKGMHSSIYEKVLYPIYKNPSPWELQDIQQYGSGEVGALLSKEGDVYIFPRDYRTHEDIADIDLGLPGYTPKTRENRPLHIYLYKDGRITAYYEEEYPDWQKSPNWIKMLGPEEIKKAV